MVKKMLNCNYRCLMLITNYSANCAPNFIENNDISNILIILGNTSAENKKHLSV